MPVYKIIPEDPPTETSFGVMIRELRAADAWEAAREARRRYPDLDHERLAVIPAGYFRVIPRRGRWD